MNEESGLRPITREDINKNRLAHVNSLNERKEILNFYKNKQEPAYARYRAGQMLNIDLNSLKSQYSNWIRELGESKKHGNLDSLDDLEFIILYEEDRELKKQAQKESGMPMIIRFFVNLYRT